MAQWHISIDTGGTFTDCIAQSPEGERRLIKVLSHSALRGRIAEVEKLSPGSNHFKLTVHHNWFTSSDIFQGYKLFLTSNPDLVATVVGSDLAHNTLWITAEFTPTNWQDQEFEITANEPAPILATRVATETPLNKVFPSMQLRLGTTIGTNVLLERKGAQIAFLVTKGFADLIEIGNQQREDLFSLNIQKREPLYHKVIEVDERLNAKGEVEIALTPNELQRVVSELHKGGYKSVAIALLHSYFNDVHEQQLRDRLKDEGIPYVSPSAEIASAIKILPRAITATVNAYLGPVLGDYLNEVASHLPLSESRFYMMTSSGGLVDYRAFYPKDSLLSGPAGGVVGAVAAARASDISHVITLDMGGTSTDVSRFESQYEYTYETRVGDAILLSPAIAIETVAAGGGSICSFDGKRFSVGPESGGANPGPACYGAGGPLTLTDIHLLLDRLDPSAFHIPVSKAASLDAFKQIMGREDSEITSSQEIWQGFLQIANERMAEAIRRISTRKGYDPQIHTLLTFGGAGGQHACAIADILGIQHVMIPYEAGLLSAYGIASAPLSQHSQQPILQTLAECKYSLDETIEQLIQDTINRLEEASSHFDSIEVYPSVHLRFEGQDHTLEVAYTNIEKLKDQFRQKYEQVFGHWVDERELEVESVKVTVKGFVETEARIEDAQDAHTSYTPQRDRQVGDHPVFQWENLRVGATIAGPAILVSANCTVFVEPEWELSIGKYLLASLKPLGTRNHTHAIDQKAVQLELFTNRFTAIAVSMGALLERTAFSVNIKERLDFSCAVLDPDGELVVNAPHIPVHLGSLGVCVRAVKKEIAMENGDVVITNHPGYGGSHLPDITLIAPVFSQEGAHLGYVANRAHHAEIGGTRPGSMPPDAVNLAQEGVVIKPDYFVKAGEVKWDFIKKLFTEASYPTRALAENLADLNAGLAAIRLGKKLLTDLADRYSTDLVLNYMAELKTYTQDITLATLEKLPQGEWEVEELLDDNTRLKLALHNKDRQLTLDFTGTAAVHPGNLNANLAIVNSAILYVIRLWIDKSIPLNEGVMKAVTVHLPEGILNPAFPVDPTDCPAVVGGNVETSQRLVDLLLKPFEAVGCSQGTMNNLLFGNEKMGYYETIGGGTGAGEGFHGASGVHQHMTNTRITDPEILELRYPIQLDVFQLRKGSGGEGKWRGGDGVVRSMTFLVPLAVTILSQHRIQVPYGIKGGEPGKPGKQYIIRSTGEHIDLSSIEGIEVFPGDQLTIETPGGGGYGLK